MPASQLTSYDPAAQDVAAREHRGRFPEYPGNELRRSRRAAGLTLRTFAQQMAVSTACASRWENNVRRPHSDDLRRISRVLQRPEKEIDSWFTAPALATECIRDARGLRVLRLQAGLSRAELADAVGVSVATIAHWECGRRSLPAQRWNSLSEILEVSPAQFESIVRSRRFLPPTSHLAMIRRHAGLTQQEVATRLGVSSGLVSQWEHRLQTPSWPNTRRLAMLFSCSVAVVAKAVGREAPVLLHKPSWRREGLGPILQAVRLWRGESRQVVADRIGVHSQTLRRWEAGATNVPGKQLTLLESALGLAPKSLPC